jgi:hypothetical protein
MEICIGEDLCQNGIFGTEIPNLERKSFDEFETGRDTAIRDVGLLEGCIPNLRQRGQILLGTWSTHFVCA